MMMTMLTMSLTTVIMMMLTMTTVIMMMMIMMATKTMLELTLCRRPGGSGHLSRRRRWSPGLSLSLQPRHLHPGRDRGLGDRLWWPDPRGLRCGEPGGLLGGPRHLLPLRRGRPGGVSLQV